MKSTLKREIDIAEEHPMLNYQLWSELNQDSEIVFYFDEETNKFYLQVWS